MRRFFRVMAAVMALFLLAACSSTTPSPSSLAVGMETETSGIEAPPAGADIALVGTPERLDSTFGQSVWGSVSRFAGESGLTAATYRTEAADESAALASLELAVKGGAQMVVTMDANVSASVADMQLRHPALYFILLDTPHGTPLANHSARIEFSALEAGWLAGYTAAAQDWQTLGAIVTETDESRQYFTGYLAGANAGVEARLVQTVASTGESASASAVEDASTTENDEQDPGVHTTVFYSLLAPEFDEESVEQQAAILYNAKPQAVFLTDFATLATTGQLASEASIPVFVPPAAEFPPWQNVAARVVQEPKNLVYGLLTQWQDDTFPGGQDIIGTVQNGDVILVPTTNAPNELAEAIEKAAKQFKNTNLSHLQEGEPDDTTGNASASAEGEIPWPESLSFPHLAVRPAPQQSEAASDVSDSGISTPDSSASAT